MKMGDELVVNIEGLAIGMATIEHVENDRATIYIPAMRVVVGVKSSLTDITPAPEVDQQILTDNPVGVEDRQAAIREEYRAAGIEVDDTPSNPNEVTSLKDMNLDSAVLDDSANPASDKK